MEKKTVVYVGGFQLPDKNAAAHRVMSNAKLLQGEGYRVVFIDTDESQTEALKKRKPCFGFERWSVNKSYKRLYSIKSFKEAMKSIADVKAVIAYNYPSVGFLKLKAYCKKQGIKLIADVTEWYGAQGTNIIHYIIKGLDSFLQMRVCFPRADGIIAVSRYLENYYKTKAPTVYLPPLTDPKEEKWQPGGEMEADNSDTVSILYAGSPGRYDLKDKLSVILKALAKCDSSKFRFKIIGVSKDDFSRDFPCLSQLLEALGESVSFLGRQPHLSVISELKGSDFSLFYRDVTRVTTAGFPTKFAEATTCKTPVMTNKTSDLAEYLTDSVNGFWIDDIEADLPRILSMDVGALKAVKQNVDSTVFDYRNYSESFGSFLNEVLR